MKKSPFIQNWRGISILFCMMLTLHSFVARPDINWCLTCVSCMVSATDSATQVTYRWYDPKLASCVNTGASTGSMEVSSCDTVLVGTEGFEESNCSNCPAGQVTVTAKWGNAIVNIIDSSSNADGSLNNIEAAVSAPADPSQLPCTVSVTCSVASGCPTGDLACDAVSFTATGTIVFKKNESGGGCGSGTCSASGNSTLGSGVADNNSVDFEINLGTPSPRYDGGILWLKATAPSTNLATPSLLQVPWPMANVTVLTNTNGWPQQVHTPQGLLNVHTFSSYEYHVECFYASNVTGPSGGFYGTNGPAYATFVIKNPDGASDYTNLWIIDEESSQNYTNKYTYLTTNGEWQLLKPDGQTTLSTWRVPNSTNASITNLYSTVSVGGNTLSQTVWTLQYVPLINNTVLLQRVDGVSSTTQTTTYSYSTNSTQSNLVQSVTYPNGNWAYYQYDSIGRKTNEFDAYENSTLPSRSTPPNPATTPCKNIQYYYSIDGLYTDTNNFYSPVETIVSIPNSSGTLKEISREYHTTAVAAGLDTFAQCPNPGLGYSDPSNFVTATQYSMTNDFSQGLPISVTHPDGTETTYEYIVASNSMTTIESDPDNSQTTTIVDAFGKTQSVTKVDLATEVVLSRLSYTYTDPLERSYIITDLAGRTTSYAYDCCNLDSTTDPDGVTTAYTYDTLKRRVAASVYYGGANAVTTTNTLDGAGRVLETQRIGTNGTIITLRQSGYDVLGRAIKQTNSLEGVTQTTYSGDGLPLIVTNVFPDGGTRIQANYGDGRDQSVTGTAVTPVQYNYGLASDGGTNREYTQTIKLNSTGGTNEWSETYADGMGRAYKKLYATASGSNPFDLSIYNFSGLAEQVDADGVTTEYGYYLDPSTENINTGQLEFTTNDPANLDMVSQVIRAVLTSSPRGNRVAATNYQFLNGQTSGTAVSSSEISANGLTNWQTVYPDGATPVVTTHVTSIGTNRTETTTAPDGSYTISLYSYGLLSSVTKYNSASAIIGETIYGYDAQSRQNAVTDARNGTTISTFNNADEVASVTTPNPGSIAGSPETTATSYDTLMRPTEITYADGTSLTNVYYQTSQIQSTYGSRMYPVGYSYDAQNRMLSMTNWTNFATSGGPRVTTWSYDAYRGFLTNKVRREQWPIIHLHRSRAAGDA